MLAEEMGGLLERSSISPNIRERRDASCALFDAAGRMVAQAAHIPVHLGAMPEAVAAVRAAGARAGEVFLLNDPAHGGSHLPDLTMVEVIRHPEAADRIIGYAAVRAHHADVGGMSPGSMPFGATELYQEGLIVPPVRIEVDGRAQADILRLVLANVRTPAEREGDLLAQRAACAAGTRGWQVLHTRMGAETLTAAIDALLDYTERRIRARLATLDGARAVARDVLESDGVGDALIPVVVSASIIDGTLHLDLSGTSEAVRGNVNAPPAVARAAAVFVLRVLCDDDVPVNDGVARALAGHPGRLCGKCQTAERGRGWQCGALAAADRCMFCRTGGRGRIHWRSRSDHSGRRAGHHEQHHARRARLELLRDAGWWTGSESPRQWPGRRACGHEQYPQHTD